MFIDPAKYDKEVGHMYPVERANINMSCRRDTSDPLTFTRLEYKYIQGEGPRRYLAAI